MKNQNYIMFPRNIFIFLLLILTLLLIHLLNNFKKLPSDLENGRYVELIRRIKSDDIMIVPLITNERKFEFYDKVTGDKIEPCGHVEGSDGKVPSGCDLRGTLNNIRTLSLTIADYKKNPDCQAMYDENGGYLYDVHRNGAKAGQYCHHPHQ